MLRNLSIRNKLVTLLAVPFVGLLLLSIYVTAREFEAARGMDSLERLTDFAVRCSAVIHEVQRERGLSAGHLGSQGARFIEVLKSQRARTDEALKAFEAFMKEHGVARRGRQFAEDLSDTRQRLALIPTWRRDVDALDVSVESNVGHYTALIGALLELAAYSIQEGTDPEITRRSLAYLNLIRAKEAAGVERAILSAAFAADSLSNSEQIRGVRLASAQEILLADASALTTSALAERLNAQLEHPQVLQADALRQTAYQSGGGRLNVVSELWWTLQTGKIDRLKEVESEMAEDLLVKARRLKAGAWRRLLVFGGLALSAIVIALVLCLRTARNIVQPIGSLVDATRGMAAGDLAVTLPPQYLERADELGELSTSFQTMAGDLQALTEALGRSNQELEEFASIAAHDLQEPLRKVVTFGERLKTKCRDGLDERGQDYLDRMIAATQRMRDMIDNLLTYSRVARGPKEFEPVDLGEIVDTVLQDLDVRLRESKGEVETASLPTVSGDRVQLRQLFQNLLANALKFHRDGVPPRVRIEASQDDRECQILVSDNGIGFEQEYRDRIFQIFKRLHGRTQYDGTGIGLALCRKIVEHHSGSIEAEGRPGEGATFTVVLPLLSG